MYPFASRHLEIGYSGSRVYSSPMKDNIQCIVAALHLVYTKCIYMYLYLYTRICLYVCIFIYTYIHLDLHVTLDVKRRLYTGCCLS